MRGGSDAQVLLTVEKYLVKETRIASLSTAVT